MYYQKPCLFNTTLLDWVTKCNTSLPQLPQIHIFQGLCEEKPSSIWGLICCNRRRISADLFLKQAPKVQASGGGGGAGGVLPLEVFWIHSDRILASFILLRLAASPSYFVRKEPCVESDQFPKKKVEISVDSHLCKSLLSFSFLFFWSANKRMLRHNIKTESVRALFLTPLVYIIVKMS